MVLWKLPPKAKIYEALTAVADNRIRMRGGNEAEVVSSDGSKSYMVRWNEDKTAFGSTDNASFWQGYIGYPIIAVLIELGEIKCPAESARCLTGVEWKQLNDTHKRQYDVVIEKVLEAAVGRGCSRTAIENDVADIYAQITTLKLQRLAVKR